MTYSTQSSSSNDFDQSYDAIIKQPSNVFSNTSSQILSNVVDKDRYKDPESTDSTKDISESIIKDTIPQSIAISGKPDLSNEYGTLQPKQSLSASTLSSKIKQNDSLDQPGINLTEQDLKSSSSPNLGSNIQTSPMKLDIRSIAERTLHSKSKSQIIDFDFDTPPTDWINLSSPLSAAILDNQKELSYNITQQWIFKDLKYELKWSNEKCIKALVKQALMDTSRNRIMINMLKLRSSPFYNNLVDQLKYTKPAIRLIDSSILSSKILTSERLLMLTDLSQVINNMESLKLCLQGASFNARELLPAIVSPDRIRIEIFYDAAGIALSSRELSRFSWEVKYYKPRVTPLSDDDKTRSLRQTLSQKDRDLQSKWEYMFSTNSEESDCLTFNRFNTKSTDEWSRHKSSINYVHLSQIFAKCFTTFDGDFSFQSKGTTLRLSTAQSSSKALDQDHASTIGQSSTTAYQGQIVTQYKARMIFDSDTITWALAALTQLRPEDSDVRPLTLYLLEHMNGMFRGHNKVQLTKWQIEAEFDPSYFTKKFNYTNLVNTGYACPTSLSHCSIYYHNSLSNNFRKLILADALVMRESNSVLHSISPSVDPNSVVEFMKLTRPSNVNARSYRANLVFSEDITGKDNILADVTIPELVMDITLLNVFQGTFLSYPSMLRGDYHRLFDKVIKYSTFAPLEFYYITGFRKFLIDVLRSDAYRLDTKLISRSSSIIPKLDETNMNEYPWTKHILDDSVEDD